MSMEVTHRLAGAVVADGLVLYTVDIYDRMKDFSDGVSPVVQDTLVEARN